VVAESRSISAAAERLHVAVSAVSRQITKLEGAFECALFDRTTKGVELTPAGERLASFVRLIRQDEDHIIEEVRGAAINGSGVVRVGCVEGLSSGFMPAVMSGFRRKFPNISISLHVAAPGEISRMLRQGEVDVVLKYCTAPEPGLESVFSCLSPIMALVAPSHELARSRKVQARDLVRYPLAVPVVGNTVRAAFDLCCSQHGITYTPAFTGNAASMAALAVQGDAVMLGGQLGAAHLINAAQLKAIKIDEKPMQTRLIHVLLLQGRTLPKMGNAFVEHLIAATQRSV